MISSSTALSRSSNSPRYFAPATIAPRSRATSRLPRKRLRDVAGDDALRESLDDGGLADAGLADEHGVVLGAPGQHLDDAADLGVAPDDRVELALAGARGEVDAVLLQRLEACPRGPALVTRAPPRTVVERVEQRVAGGAVPRRAARRRRRRRRPARAAGARSRRGESPRAVARSCASASTRCSAPDACGPDTVVPAAARQPGDRRSRRQHVRLPAIGADLGEQRRGDALGLVEQGQQEVGGLELRVAVAHRALLGCGRWLRGSCWSGPWES